MDIKGVAWPFQMGHAQDELETHEGRYTSTKAGKALGLQN
jgi:hypothetical protein